MKPSKRKSHMPDRRTRLEKRLCSYGLAAGAMMAGGATANAAVVTVDYPTPPTTPTNGNLYFSLQTGAFSTVAPVGSFRLHQGSSTSNIGGTAFGIANGGQVAGLLPGYGFKFGSNITIGASKNFIGNAVLGNKSSGGLSGGVWNPGGVGFLGLSFTDLTSATHYGWAEVRFNSDYTTTLYAVGYESDPGTAITTPAVSVPEPGELALLAIGAVGLGIVRKRRQSKAAADSV